MRFAISTSPSRVSSETEPILRRYMRTGSLVREYAVAPEARATEQTDPAALPVAMGSHLDSQPSGGKFDGAYGVMAGLEVVRTSYTHATLFPILYLVQDNDWGISASGNEMRAMNAFEYAAGFKGMKRYTVDGSDFIKSHELSKAVITEIRMDRGPALIHANDILVGYG